MGLRLVQASTSPAVRQRRAPDVLRFGGRAATGAGLWSTASAHYGDNWKYDWPASLESPAQSSRPGVSAAEILFS